MNYPTRDAYQQVRQVSGQTGCLTFHSGSLNADDIVLTHGGQSGHLRGVPDSPERHPKPVVLVEDLSYAGFRRAGELMRAEVSRA